MNALFIKAGEFRKGGFWIGADNKETRKIVKEINR